MRRMLMAAVSAASLMIGQAQAQSGYGYPPALPQTHYTYPYYRPPVPAYQPTRPKPASSNNIGWWWVVLGAIAACAALCPSGSNSAAGARGSDGGGSLQPPAAKSEQDSSGGGYHVAPIDPFYGSGPGGNFYNNGNGH